MDRAAISCAIHKSTLCGKVEWRKLLLKITSKFEPNIQLTQQTPGTMCSIDTIIKFLSNLFRFACKKLCVKKN